MDRNVNVNVAGLIRISMKDVGGEGPVLLNSWTYLNLIPNTIFLPLLVMTFLLSKRARRDSTLVNLCLTWILSGVFFLLLFYTGQQRGHEPNASLCLIQASLLQGIFPMSSVSTLMMTYYMYVAFSGDPDNIILSKVKRSLMLSAPYVAQSSFTIATLVLALNHPHKVNRRRRFFYCSLGYNPIWYATYIFTFFVCLVIIAIKVNIAIVLSKNWRVLHRAGRTSDLDVQLLLRVLVFGLYIGFGIVVSFICAFDKHTIVPDVYFAVSGAVIFLVFGTQADVLRTWCFWKRYPDPIPIFKLHQRRSFTRASMDIEIMNNARFSQPPLALILPRS